MNLAEAFEAERYEVVRSWTRETGEPALLLKPPVIPADMDEVALIIELAGSVSAEGYPTWMQLRKLVLVVTTA